MRNVVMLSVLGVSCLSAFSGAAEASCADNRLNHTQINALLSGRTVCASVGADSWQEYHQAGGALIDYKKGSNDPVDPTKTVGTWTIPTQGSNATIRHTYNAFGSPVFYDYSVHTSCDINTLATCDHATFCGATNVEAIIKTGQVACSP